MVAPLIIAAGIGAAANLAGGLIQSSGQNAANSAMMQFNADQAQMNRDFQERMRNTAYQVAMYDMQKAGLNPILAANLGGAAVPSGSTASVNLGNAGLGLGQGVASAGQIGQRYLDMKATAAQSEKDETAAAFNVASEKLATNQAQLASDQSARTQAETRNLDVQTMSEMMRQPGIPEDIKNKILQQGLTSVETGLKQRQLEDERMFGSSPEGQKAASALRALRSLPQTPEVKRAIQAIEDAWKNITPGSASTPSPSPNPHLPPGSKGNTVLDSPVPQSNILGIPSTKLR